MLPVCRQALWQALHDAADAAAVTFGNADPSQWIKKAATTGFVPGLLPNRFPTTNRPTFQQVLELDHNG